MRICFAQDRPVYPLFIGGAEVSMHESLRLLSQAGHTCLAVGHVSDRILEMADWLHTKPARVLVCEHELRGLQTGVKIPAAVEVVTDVGYEVRMTALSNFFGFLNDIMQEFRPDVVFSQLNGSERVIHAAIRKDAHVYHTIRDLSNPHNFIAYYSDLVRRGSFKTLTTSQFMQRQVKSRHNLESAVLYPAIDIKRFNSIAKTKGKAVMMFNPISSKGADIVRKLIKNLPDIDFVLVEGWEQINPQGWSFKNVRVVRKTHDVERLYAQARVVIIPSQSEEAFCRVGVEAQAAGIPVLASAHSGLCESLGQTDGLVHNYRSPKEWLARLRVLLSSPDEMQTLKKQGLLNCKRFDLKNHARALTRILSNA